MIVIVHKCNFWWNRAFMSQPVSSTMDRYNQKSTISWCFDLYHLNQIGSEKNMTETSSMSFKEQGLHLKESGATGASNLFTKWCIVELFTSAKWTQQSLTCNEYLASVTGELNNSVGTILIMLPVYYTIYTSVLYWPYTLTRVQKC